MSLLEFEFRAKNHGRSWLELTLKTDEMKWFSNEFETINGKNHVYPLISHENLTHLFPKCNSERSSSKMM